MGNISLSLAQTTQSADLTTLTFTDNTGVYANPSNTGGWGTPNFATTTINTTGKLSLSIVLSTPEYPDGITYTTDLYTILYRTLSAPPADVTELVYVIYPNDFIDDNGDALGAQTDPFPDGWYDVSYIIANRGDGLSDTYTTSFFLDGNVFSLITDHLVNIPEIYMYLDKFLNNYGSDEIIDTLYETALFESMEANVAAANKDEIIEVLDTLQNITANE